MNLKQLRRRIGLYLRRRFEAPTQEFALERLRLAGFQPRLLLDVGASTGSFVDEARAEWPELAAHCFEPDEEYIRMLEIRASQDPRLTVCGALVGARESPEVPYYFVRGGSTVFQENRIRRGQATLEDPGPLRKARMVTLDGYCAGHRLTPQFLKIDVQGYELEVLKGAERTLPSIEVIQTEVNYAEVIHQAPLAAELIGWLDARGYAVQDIFNFMRRPLDDALWQTDMIFVRRDSPLRARKAWRAIV